MHNEITTRPNTNIHIQLSSELLADTTPLCSDQYIYLFIVVSITTQSEILVGYKIQPTSKSLSAIYIIQMLRNKHTRSLSCQYQHMHNFSVTG